MICIIIQFILFLRGYPKLEYQTLSFKHNFRHHQVHVLRLITKLLCYFVRACVKSKDNLSIANFNLTRRHSSSLCFVEYDSVRFRVDYKRLKQIYTFGSIMIYNLLNQQCSRNLLTICLHHFYWKLNHQLNAHWSDLSKHNYTEFLVCNENILKITQ